MKNYFLTWGPPDRMSCNKQTNKGYIKRKYLTKYVTMKQGIQS